MSEPRLQCLLHEMGQPDYRQLTGLQSLPQDGNLLPAGALNKGAGMTRYRQLHKGAPGMVEDSSDGTGALLVATASIHIFC